MSTQRQLVRTIYITKFKGIHYNTPHCGHSFSFHCLWVSFLLHSAQIGERNDKTIAEIINTPSAPQTNTDAKIAPVLSAAIKEGINISEKINTVILRRNTSVFKS